MKRITFLITLLFALTCQAQLLWKVSGGTLEKPSYLFGTYHLMPSAFVDSVPGLNDAIKNVDAVWVEVENSQMTAPATVMKMAKMMIAPPTAPSTRYSQRMPIRLWIPWCNAIWALSASI